MISQPSVLFSEKRFEIGTVDLETYMKAPNNHLEKLSIPKENEYYSQTMSCYKNGNKIMIMGIDRPHPGMSSYNKVSGELLLHFVIGGKGIINGTPFERGIAFYTPKYVPYTLIVDSDDPWFLIWLAVDDLWAKKIAAVLEEMSENNILRVCDPDALLRLVRFWMYDMPHTAANFGFYEGMFQQLISFLEPLYPTDPVDKEQISQRLLRIIYHSTQYIESNLSTVTVAELAKLSNLEHTYFTRVFISVKGMSPKEYILNAKIDMAKHYLTATDYSIDKINTMLGYNHRNSFPSLFKKKLGMSPLEYRSKNSK